MNAPFWLTTLPHKLCIENEEKTNNLRENAELKLCNNYGA